MQRLPDSHKGDNGKVAIIGGSRHQHGAPLFSALSAEASGVDLLYVLIPNDHENVAKTSSLNFQVIPLDGDSIEKHHVDLILTHLATMDSAVVGPGIAREEKNLSAIQSIIGSAACSLVLDAAALQAETLKNIKGKSAVLTPHLAELQRMKLIKKDLPSVSKHLGLFFVLKGPEDLIISPDGRTKTIAGGNAGLTVGGTGDALAGLIAGFIAQKINPFDASCLASTIIKKAGEILYKEKGYAYTTMDVIRKIPQLLK